MKPVKVGTFTPSTVLQIAHTQGYFGSAGIEVEEISVHSSPGQFESLEAGLIDIALTNPDNVIAYAYLTENPLHRNLELRILAAIDRGLGVSLSLAPGVDQLDANLTLGVDVSKSGFAICAYALLEKLGFEFGRYKIVDLGSTPKRAEALIKGEISTTILNAGNEIRAAGHGCHIIAEVTDLGPYIGTVAAVIGNPDPSLIQVSKILTRVCDEILAGEHKELVCEFAKDRLKLDDAQALEHYEKMLNPKIGLIRGGMCDMESLETIIRIRSQYFPTTELANAVRKLPKLLAN